MVFLKLFFTIIYLCVTFDRGTKIYDEDQRCAVMICHDVLYWCSVSEVSARLLPAGQVWKPEFSTTKCIYSGWTDKLNVTNRFQWFKPSEHRKNLRVFKSVSACVFIQVQEKGNERSDDDLQVSGPIQHRIETVVHSMPADVVFYTVPCTSILNKFLACTSLLVHCRLAALVSGAFGVSRSAKNLENIGKMFTLHAFDFKYRPLKRKGWQVDRAPSRTHVNSATSHFVVEALLYMHTYAYIFPQTVCLTLGVLTVIVKGRVPRSRCRTDFVAIFVVSCLHVRFSSLFTYFRACRARRDWLLNVNFRSFRLFNFFDVRFSW